jgi:hypothetical protein
VNKEAEPDLEIITTVLNAMTELDEDNVSKSIKSISLLSPKRYFDNLQYHNEYIWVQNHTLRHIIKIIAEITIEYSEDDLALNISCFHSILWINEEILKQLTPIWDIIESEKIYEYLAEFKVAL